MTDDSNAAIRAPNTTLGQRIDAMSTGDQGVLRLILRNALRSEEDIRDRLHGDPRAPSAKVRADVLAAALGGARS